MLSKAKGDGLGKKPKYPRSLRKGLCLFEDGEKLLTLLSKWLILQEHRNKLCQQISFLKVELKNEVTEENNLFFLAVCVCDLWANFMKTPTLVMWVCRRHVSVVKDCATSKEGKCSFYILQKNMGDFPLNYLYVWRNFNLHSH